MADDLDVERQRLLARLAVLQAEHEAIHARPNDLDRHQQHRARLLAYGADVHAYREKLAALRQERGLPDPEPFA